MRYIDRILLLFANNERRNKILRKYYAHIGKNCFICNKLRTKEPWLVYIEDNVIVATGVSFVTHDASYYNIHRYLGIEGDDKLEKMGSIILRNNCYIGCNSVLLPGSEIGENSIIAAGSIVNKRIPQNEVWGGVPARKIMDLEEYCKKVVEQTNILPWKGKVLNAEELKEERIKYYLKNNL